MVLNKHTTFMLSGIDIQTIHITNLAKLEKCTFLDIYQPESCTLHQGFSSK
jgi:hypothetical protein